MHWDTRQAALDSLRQFSLHARAWYRVVRTRRWSMDEWRWVECFTRVLVK
jgi:hypothetical protein